MLKQAASLFGILFLLVGILGFVPGVTNNEMLLGIFHVNTAHNIVHLLSGVLALWAGRTSAAYVRMYFRIFGIVYALVAVLGYLGGNAPLLGVISNNTADTWLHAVIAATSLWLGFAAKDR